MCELFAACGSRPLRVSYSLHEFARLGAGKRANKSGWGIAWYRTRDAFAVKEEDPAADSALARFVAGQPIESRLVIAHVRRASRGGPAYENTHPFARVLGGRGHYFAHNGTLAGFRSAEAGTPHAAEVIGETDSELAFCKLLARLRPLWQGREVPDIMARLAVFAETAAELVRYGSANVLYTDGDALFVHAHRRQWEQPDGSLSAPRAPGLHLRRCHGDSHMAGHGCAVESRQAPTTLIASVPFEGGAWEPLPEGCALALKGGMEAGRIATL